MVAAVYLFNDKPAGTTSDAVWACQVAIYALWISCVLFARLWLEVSLAERLLIDTKQATLVHQRREAFLSTTTAAEPHDFESDPELLSYSAAATHVTASSLK